MTTTYYVSLFRQWQVKKNRWSTRFGAGTELPYMTEGSTALGIWQVDAASRDEAIGGVAEYLARGKPSSMTVVEKLWNPDR